MVMNVKGLNVCVCMCVCYCAIIHFGDALAGGPATP